MVRYVCEYDCVSIIILRLAIKRMGVSGMQFTHSILLSFKVANNCIYFFFSLYLNIHLQQQQ